MIKQKFTKNKARANQKRNKLKRCPHTDSEPRTIDCNQLLIPIEPEAEMFL